MPENLQLVTLESTPTRLSFGSSTYTELTRDQLTYEIL